MKKRMHAALMALALVSSGAQADWSAAAGRYAIHQTAQDLTVTASSRVAPLFSAKAFAADQYKRLLTEFELPPVPTGASPKLYVRHVFSFISLTGSLLAIKDVADVDVKGNAIPAGKAQFWTIDLDRGANYGFAIDPLDPSAKSPRAFVDFRDFFSDAAIAAATARTDLGRRAAPKSQADLRDVMYDLSRIGLKPPDCFLPSVQATYSFAFVASGPSAIGANLGFPGQSYCRTKLTVLRLDIPRSALRRPLGPLLSPPANLPDLLVQIGTEPKD